MAVCKRCQGRGLWQYCSECGRPIDFAAEQRIYNPKPQKKHVDYAQQNLDAIHRYKELENIKVIRRMVTAFYKVNPISDDDRDDIDQMILDGSTFLEVAAQIKELGYGEISSTDLPESDNDDASPL